MPRRNAPTTPRTILDEEHEIPIADEELAVLDADGRPIDEVDGVLPADAAHGPTLTGGDLDAAWDQADSGEETVGGSAPTPDQDMVDDLGRAAGVDYPDEHPLALDKVAVRDDERWELDPASSEDFDERSRRQSARSRPK